MLCGIIKIVSAVSQHLLIQTPVRLCAAAANETPTDPVLDWHRQTGPPARVGSPQGESARVEAAVVMVSFVVWFGVVWFSVVWFGVVWLMLVRARVDVCCSAAVLWCDVVDWCGRCWPRLWLWWWPPAAAARLGPPAAPAPGPPARPARPASQSRAVSSSRRTRTAVTSGEESGESCGRAVVASR